MLLKHESLAQMALFAGLSDSEVQALAQRSVERRFAAEEMLFWEGEPCTGIFLLTQGSVKIFKTSAAGREMMLSLETAPSSVAELPLFDGGPYPASVRAVGPVLALFINKSDFHQVCRQFPDVALKLLAVVGRRLRHLVGVVESMTFGSVTQRLARLLLDSLGAGRRGRVRSATDASGTGVAIGHGARSGVAQPGAFPRGRPGADSGAPVAHCGSREPGTRS